jgi:hypothetical protein
MHRGDLPRPTRLHQEGVPTHRGPRITAVDKKYGALLLFSMLTSLIVLAAYRSSNPHSEISLFGALAMGFGWEASVEKLFTTRP